jgi:DNA mismatch repair ATPase MutS
MLRNFSSDAPIEGRSSFAVEMQEMRYVLQDASDKSLVLIDELGKGTEARAGTALAAAMLEELDRIGCSGIFATHLHGLLDLLPPSEDPNIQRETIDTSLIKVNKVKKMRMEVEQVSTEEFSDISGSTLIKKPTWRMVKGESRESLAMEVAREMRLSDEVVERAQQIYEELEGLSVKEGEVSMMQGSSDERTSASAFPSSSASGPSDKAFTPQMERRRAQLKELGELLESTARDILVSSDGGPNKPAERSRVQGPFYVHRNRTPPPHATNTSTVYIAQRTDGYVYVGRWYLFLSPNF